MPVKALLICTLLLTGCSSEMIYATVRNVQRHECLKQINGARERCLQDADMRYDDYKKEAKTKSK